MHLPALPLRRFRSVLALALAGLGLAGAAPAQAPTGTVDADPLLRARSAAQAFAGRLRQTLQSAMATGGPVAAVDVCHAAAPAIAAAVEREQGVRLGRVALPGRNRNPVQAAAGWQRTGLERMQAAVAAGQPAGEQVQLQRDGLPEGVALRMLRGIATEPGCLACHGRQVAAPVRAAIARHYPGDGATGFDVGDLRGALWVEVPMASAIPEPGTSR